VVDTYSSSTAWGGEIKQSIPANHSDMTKFSGMADPGFVRVSAALARCVRHIEKKKGAKPQSKQGKFPRRK
jgi:hypothetical protein